MDAKERIETALDRKEPDHVPIWELAYNESSIIGIASRFIEQAHLPEPKMVVDMTGEEKIATINALVTFIKELDIDGATAFPMIPRERIDEDHIKDAFGITSHLSPLGEPHPIEGPVTDMETLKSYVMREPEESDFLMLDVLRQALPDKSIAFDTQGTFRISWGLVGSMEKLLMDYILEPEFAKGLADMVTEYVLKVVDMAFDRGADWLLLDGDLAFNTGPLMSPAHYDEFIGPFHKKICDLVHKRGKKVVKHSDGELTPLVPALMEAGVDGIHPIQPQCMDIRETKKRFGDRLCIVGNIDCSDLLVNGTEKEVDEVVRDTIEKAAPGGGYIISSSNSIHPGVNPDNYIAMVKATKKYGIYGSLGKASTTG